MTVFRLGASVPFFSCRGSRILDLLLFTLKRSLDQTCEAFEEAKGISTNLRSLRLLDIYPASVRTLWQENTVAINAPGTELVPGGVNGFKRLSMHGRLFWSDSYSKLYQFTTPQAVIAECKSRASIGYARLRRLAENRLQHSGIYFGTFLHMLKPADVL
jgi:hypothetical protein